VKVWKVILATLVIFAAGVLTGAVISRYHHRPRHPFFPFHQPGATNQPNTGSNREPRGIAMPFVRPPAATWARNSWDGSTAN